MSDGRLRSLLALAALIAAVGCEVHNKNSVACHDDDCAASCETLGYSGGACDDDECVCDPGDGGPYDWDAGGDSDTDSDSDSDSDSDTDQDTDGDAG